jgi:hypothetical protein
MNRECGLMSMGVKFMLTKNDDVALESEGMNRLWDVAYQASQEQIDISHMVATRSKDLLEFIASINPLRANDIGQYLALQYPHDPIAWLEIRRVIARFQAESAALTY